MDPWLPLGVGSSIAGTVSNIFGGNSQAKAMRQAMEKYLAYQDDQRRKFLDSPETGAIRSKLNQYIAGDVGYGEDFMRESSDRAYEDYGKGLSDLSRMANESATAKNAGGTIYTPGRRDRTTRLLGQNLASQRANTLRDLNQKNRETALSNQRFAISALPTFMPGTPATPMAGPDVFQGLNATNPVGSYVGQGFNQFANPMYSVWMQNEMGPLYEKLYQARFGAPAAVAAPSGGGVNWNAPNPAMYQFDANYDYGL